MPEFSSPWDIRLDHVCAGYGSRVVLKDVDVVIPSGKITVILGESGCGKSTLLRHIVGLSRPISGKILYGGHDFFALPRSQFRRIRRRFGVLFQDGALLGSLTLAQNVALPLSEHTKLSDALIKKIAVQTLALVGLADFADFYPNELSGGMKKRGGLARAIVTEPPILFCDEPTSGLDPINAAQMDQLLLDMHGIYPDRTIVVVSHDLASVARIAEHVLILRDGGIIFAGTWQEMQSSTDAYLRQFVDRQTHSAEKALTAIAPSPEVRAALDAWFQAE